MIIILYIFVVVLYNIKNISSKRLIKCILAYFMGVKQLVLFDRIKFDGLRNRDWIIYKYPVEDIRQGSTLIVNEGQVAILVKGGAICDVFTAGTHVLSTDNLPILGKLVNFIFDNKTPFSAEIYYVNLVSKFELYWGTSDPIQLIDPKYFVKLRVRAFGQIDLRIDDYMTFFRELIGGMNLDEVVQYEKVLDYFRGMIVTHIKSELANKIIHDKISALEIAAELRNISNQVETVLKTELENFGFELVNFHVQSINFPDEDFEKINDILADRAEFEIMGDRYITKRSFDVYEASANNSNGVAGALLAGGIGVGLGQTAMQSIPNQVSALQPQSSMMTCSSCKSQVSADSKFCQECGHSLDKKIECPNCHFENLENARFCSDCGHNLQKKVCECGTELNSGVNFCNNCGKKV